MPYDLLTVFSCYLCPYSIRNCWTWFSHLKKRRKKKKGEGGRQERARAELVSGAREGERLVLESFLLMKIALGYRSVFITYTRGQQTVRPWKPELSPQTEQATAMQIIWSCLFLHQERVQRRSSVFIRWLYFYFLNYSEKVCSVLSHLFFSA